MQEFVFAAKEIEKDNTFVPLYPNQKGDFISNVNLLAQHIGLLRDQAPVLGNEGVRELLAASKSILKEVIEDVHKGATPQGYRKIDIDLEENLQEEKQLIRYDKAIVETNDGLYHTIEFTEAVYSLIDVAYQIEQGIIKLTSELKVVNTTTEIIPKTGLFQGMLRIRDSLEVYGEFSNVKNVELFATKDTLHIAAGNGIYKYDWNKTTSAILTLHTNLDTFLDILNKVTLMYEEILRILEEMRRLHKDVDEWRKEIEGWYNEILIMYNEIKAMKLEITNMYNEIKVWHEEILETKDLILNAVQNASPYIVITEDTEIDIKHIGGMLQCVVPLDTDIITLTVGKDIEWKASMEFMFVPKGKGTVLIKAKGDMVIEAQTGTAPLVKGSGKVGCAKLEPDVKTWCVFGALEDI